MIEPDHNVILSPTTLVALTTDRYLALMWFFLRYAGLEPALGDLPPEWEARFAPDTLDRWAGPNRRYFRDGGTDCPYRWIISER